MDGQAARWPWRSRYNPHRRADDPGHEKSQNVSTKEENFAIVVQRISRVREHTIRAKVFLMQRLSTRTPIGDIRALLELGNKVESGS